MKVVICDIDNTLADPSHRTHFVNAGDFRAYFDAMKDDSVIEPTSCVLKALTQFGLKIVFCSTRQEGFRKPIEKWIRDNVAIDGFEVMLRRNGDKRHDIEVKKEMLDKLRVQGHEILFAIEDRQDVVSMYNESGVSCLKYVQQ